VGNLHRAGVQVVGMAAQLSDTRLHRVSGPGRLFKEHQEHGLVFEVGGVQPHGKFLFKIKRNFQQCIYFFFGPFLQSNKCFPLKQVCIFIAPSVLLL
jgi:hypothetical protein